MERAPLSLRKHLVWILLVKLVAIVALRLVFFPPLEATHQPADLFDSPSSHPIATKEPS